MKNSTDEIENRKKELEDLEEQLQVEEKELDIINQELKGKTDVYVQEIEEHQLALAPWTEKINEKKHIIDVKKSERDIFSERITAGKKAVESAEQELASIEESHKSKVCTLLSCNHVPRIVLISFTNISYQLSESKELKVGIQDIQQDLGKLEKKIQVSNGGLGFVIANFRRFSMYIHHRLLSRKSVQSGFR